MPCHPPWQGVGMGMPPQAARAEGPPRSRPRRCINRAKRTTRRGRILPSGGQEDEIAAERRIEGTVDHKEP
jgi:hypothetical protein